MVVFYPLTRQLGTRVIDKSLPIRSIEFNTHAQKYKGLDFTENWYIGLPLGVELLDTRSSAAVLPAERYFTDTAAEISP